MQAPFWKHNLNKSAELLAAVNLMAEIKALFPEGEIYIVGGVPRDIVLGEKIDDVDLATNIPFNKLSKHFELRDISKNGSQPVHKINYRGFSLDLAQFRTDSKTVGRANNVSTITDSFKSDSARRDLTINSLGIDENGNIFDFQGGIDDLNNKVIKTVGNAHERFLEDVTRILRVVRFAAKMNFKIEKKTQLAICEMKELLLDRSAISNESISKEFFKVAKSGPALGRFIDHLDELGILELILPEFTAFNGLLHNVEHHPEGGGTVRGHVLECLFVSESSDPVVNLGILFHDLGKAVTYEFVEGKHTYHGHEGAGVPIVEGIFSRLVFCELSAKDKEAILFITDKHMMVHKLNELSVKTLNHLVNSPHWEVLKAVSFADEASRGAPLFDVMEFKDRIENAEAKIKALGDAQEIKNKIKVHISGHLLIEWFPAFGENNKLIGGILPKLQDHVLNLINEGEEVKEEKLKEIVKIFLQNK